MNDAKSAPFAHMVKTKKKSKYPPKVVKRPLFWQITQNSPTIFRFGPREMETSNFIANHAKLVQFMQISKIPCSLSKTAIFTANHAKSAQFANPYSESREISQIHAIFNYCSIFVFRHL